MTLKRGLKSRACSIARETPLAHGSEGDVWRKCTYNGGGGISRQRGAPSSVPVKATEIDISAERAVWLFQLFKNL